jgi:hypothetical protein
MSRRFDDMSRQQLLEALEQELSWVELFLAHDGDGQWTTLRRLLEQLGVLTEREG